MDYPIDWLLTGPSWVEYRTRIDLLGFREEDDEARTARERMQSDSAIRMVVNELAGWPGHVLSSHKSASQHFHKLNFIADLGFKAEDEGIQIIIDKILAHQAVEGPFQLPTQVPVHFGGSGEETGAWALCDAPLILYALSKLGLAGDPRVRKGIDYLAALGRDNGWPCAVSKELGKFRGPGRKEDPCPYATLAMLKLLSIDPRDLNTPQAKNGVESLLDIWDQRQDEHPYMFYMGTDFSKLKAPLVWYDLLHVLDVLTHYTDYRKDPRLLSMVDVLIAKADPNGRFTPESIWTAWKDWEFGQKKVPSYWVTFLADRIMQRIEKRE